MALNAGLRLMAARGSTTWTPASISGLARWYDPSDAATVSTTGSEVTQLRDKSGGGYHLGSASTQYPTIGAASGWGNSLNVLTFDGTNDVLYNTTNIEPSLTWFVVTKKPDSANTDVLIRVDGHATYLSGGPSVQTFTGSVGATWSSTSSDWTNAHVYCLTLTTTTGNSYIDGTQKLSGTSMSDLTGDGVLIGADSTAGGSAGNWLVGEIIIYNSVLGTTDRQTVESYLRTKWGTP